MNNIPTASEMLVKVGYITEVMTNGPSTEAMLKQPVTEPLQKLP